MKIAASILDCKDRIEGTLELGNTNVSYIHIDIMDGNFVPSVQFSNINEIKEINKVSRKPLDVHLMVDNPIRYIKELNNMNIEFITIHLEIIKEKQKLFKEIKALGYKVGLSIKPGTDVNELVPYLDDIDLILIMSVEPGLGGQKFMEDSIGKVNELKNLITKSGRNILIEVDGGINRDNITKLDDIDIAVVGSYITKFDDYNKQVEELFAALVE